MPSISAPVALLGAGALSAAGSAIGGAEQAGAAGHASDVQQHMYDTTRGDLLPYSTGGQGDFTAMNRLLTGPPSEIEANLEALPGYQFTRTQGLKAVQSSAAARGLGVSGAALKGAATYATGLADQTYGNQVNRLLAGATLGEDAAAKTGVAGSAAASGVGNALIQQGNAIAGGITGATSGIGQGLVGYGMYGGAGGGAGNGFSDTAAANEAVGLY